MNNLLNEYLRFNFELNIELNHFLARFNVKMNNQNLSLTPPLHLATAARLLSCSDKYKSLYSTNMGAKLFLV